MTIAEIKERTNVKWIGTCQYEVTIIYRGKTYKCKSNNSLAWDRLDDNNYPDNCMVGAYTNKGAWLAFYDECKRANRLGEYNY